MKAANITLSVARVQDREGEGLHSAWAIFLSECLFGVHASALDMQYSVV